MAKLPPLVRTHLTEDDAREVIAHIATSGRDLGEFVPGTIKDLTIGYSSSVFKFDTTEGSYVVAVSAKPSREDVFEVPHLFTKALHSGGASVPEAVGEIGVLAQNGRKYRVMEFIDGVQPLVGDITKEQLASLGEELGKFHIVAAALNPAEYESNEASRTSITRVMAQARRTVTNVVGSYIEADPTKIPYMALAHGAYTMVKSMAGSYKDLPKGVVHGDVHSENLIFKGDKAVILDMEGLYHGTLIDDVVSATVRLAMKFNHENHLVFDKEKAGALLQAYDKARPFTDREKQVLPDKLVEAAMIYKVLIGANQYMEDMKVPGCGKLHPDELMEQMDTTVRGVRAMNIRKLLSSHQGHAVDITARREADDSPGGHAH